MNVEEFIKQFEKPYTKISNIKVNEDGSISYDERYDLKHPDCPIVYTEMGHQVLTLNCGMSKDFFKVISGSVEVID